VYRHGGLIRDFLLGHVADIIECHQSSIRNGVGKVLCVNGWDQAILSAGEDQCRHVQGKVSGAIRLERRSACPTQPPKRACSRLDPVPESVSAQRPLLLQINSNSRDHVFAQRICEQRPIDSSLGWSVGAQRKILWKRGQ